MDVRDLPSVEAVVNSIGDAAGLPRGLVTHLVRTEIDEARADLLSGKDSADPITRSRAAIEAVGATRPRRVVNATGVLLHTNLGRAPASSSSADVLRDVAAGYSNVEIDITTGRRAGRHDYLSGLIRLTTGADSGFAVNNNAGALLLALASTVGRGGRVAVSRGELIEIGGSFRLPDLMASSGVRLVEVGTTNRTRLSDFESVVDDVDAVLKVHPSNYRIDGFHEEATWAELADLADRSRTPFIADVGSGLLDQPPPWVPTDLGGWLRDEPGVRQTVALGASLVLFSGDKLLGGPQAGIIAGRSEDVARTMAHPLARALRLDGGTIAALGATLEAYLDQRVHDLPFWRMATVPVDQLMERAKLVANDHPCATAITTEAVPGAGSVPSATIPSAGVAIEGPTDAIWHELASAPTPIIATRRAGTVVIDLRSVDSADDAMVAAAISKLG
ncbi:MAG: L-seryl-tRNA(Sec) selenium transferase [Acidimicrobiia bacterium]|nr:L-seryl-tRNA(Sec) selenium transferase [Acidimicrobiia bacterium]